MTDTPNPPPTEPPPMEPTPGAPDPADVEKNKVFALFSYLGILVLVPILAAKDSPFAKYHANQGLLLLLAAICLGCVSTIGVFILAHIPFVGCAAPCLFPVMSVAILVYMIMGIINAVNGKMKPLPGFPAITLIK